MRVIIFVDYWNFQINWNERVQRRCNWSEIPILFINKVKSLFTVTNENFQPEYQGTKVYASVNPAVGKDNRLRNYLERTLKKEPGFDVYIKERHWKKRSVKCNNPQCRKETVNCPHCDSPFQRASEKGVDAAIITDMLKLHCSGVYNVAVLVSADSDLIPMVEYLQDHNVKVINAAWKNYGYDLLNACWAHFYIDDLTNQLSLNLS